MKKRRILSLITVCLLSLSMIAGCSNKENESSSSEASEISSEVSKTEEKAKRTPRPKKTDEPESSSEVSPEPTETAIATGTKPDFGPLSDDKYSFQIQVDNDVYQLPMTFSQFTAYGWTYKEDASTKLDSNYVASVEEFTLGDLKCYASIVNFDINAKPISECYIGEISFDSYQVKDSSSKIIIPGGFEFGVAKFEDVKAKYGTPTYEHTSTSGTETIEYTKESYQKITLRFDGSTKLLSDVEVENIKKPDDFVEGTVGTDVPASVTNYKAPTAISDNFGDWTVEYGGSLYTIPAPVSEFVKNGWQIDKDNSAQTISGRGGEWVKLKKDNKQIKNIANNYSKDATNPEK